MSSNYGQTAVKVLTIIGGYMKLFLLNTWRRLLMLGRYMLICFTQQRLRWRWSRLGRQVMVALAEGEVNPLLTDRVKDALERARALQAVKDKHYRAIEALREKVRAACACASPETANSFAGEPPAREPETEQEPR